MGFNKFKDEISKLDKTQLKELLDKKEKEMITYNNPKFKRPLWDTEKNKFMSQYDYKRATKEIAIIKTILNQ